MGASEPLPQAALGLADLQACLALSAAAGWNQTLDDWRVFITEGPVSGCRDLDGRLIASAAALPYGGGLGWISMVLVDPAWRQRGLATQLLQSCIAELQARNVVPVLDATPAGMLVYSRLGFKAGFELERWEIDAASAAPAASGVLPAGAEALDLLVSLDRAATGLDRRFLLQSFLARAGSLAWHSDDGRGFVVLRRGQRALQIGPLVAADEAAAVALLQTALASASGPVFLDVPVHWAGLSGWLAQQGFRRQRPFVRMALAPTAVDAVAGVHPQLFVIAGPEFG